MKQKTSKIAVILIAFVIFLTGTGATIAKFCCDNCVNQFLTSAGIISPEDDHHDAESSCCAHQEAEEKAKACEHESSEKTCCQIERKSVTLDSYHFKPVVFAPVYWITADFTASMQSDYLSATAFDVPKRITDSPPKITPPRSYLSFIRILII